MRKGFTAKLCLCDYCKYNAMHGESNGGASDLNCISNVLF